MKIQCDVCGKDEASLFCCADEAALCQSCDTRVHLANKLAEKHQRFSLISPSSPSLHPRCDVCQEKRAFLFCQEDRAILCRDCDGPIHTANELTKKHNRFLLTGVKLSPTASPAEASEAPSPAVTGPVTSSSSSLRVELDSRAKKKKKVAVVEEPERPPPPLSQNQSSSCNSDSDASIGGKGKVVVLEGQASLVGDTASGGAGDGSSISDYLIKTLPGWRVEDLLLLDYPSSSLPFSSAAPTNTFYNYKMGGMVEEFMPFVEADLEAGRGFGCPEAPVWWAPQVPQAPPQGATTISFNHGGEIGGSGGGGQPRWVSDDGFTVPQILSQQQHQVQCNRRLSSSSLWYTRNGNPTTPMYDVLP